MAVVVLVLRPAAIAFQALVTNQAINPGFTNLVRWQNHWHVVRQSWTFFQNDFAGRIANRVMQTGPSLRESVVSATNALWYILVYGTSALVLLGSNDFRLTIPVLLWFAAYAGVLRFFVPRVRVRSRRMSEARSNLTGRVVDSYTNILTVKLFADPSDEDAFVRAAVDDHTDAFRGQLRLITLFGMLLTALNAALMVGTGAVAIWLWTRRPHQRRRRRHGAAADLADRQHGGLGRAERDLDLRECRHGAGRHALHRRAAPDARSARRRHAARRPAAAFASRGCSSAMAPRAACFTASIWRSRRASGSASSARRAPASRPSSTCCCAFTSSKAGAS